jgi:hypothetical protein
MAQINDEHEHCASCGIIIYPDSAWFEAGDDDKYCRKCHLKVEKIIRGPKRE